MVITNLTLAIISLHFIPSDHPRRLISVKDPWCYSAREYINASNHPVLFEPCQTFKLPELLTFFPDRASSPLVTIEHPTGDTLGMDKDTNTATARHGLNPNDQSFYVIENSTTSLAVAAVKIKMVQFQGSPNTGIVPKDYVINYKCLTVRINETQGNAYGAGWEGCSGNTTQDFTLQPLSWATVGDSSALSLSTSFSSLPAIGTLPAVVSTSVSSSVIRSLAPAVVTSFPSSAPRVSIISSVSTTTSTSTSSSESSTGSGSFPPAVSSL